MRKFRKLLPAAVLAMAAGEASAQLVYEPFNYTIGSSPNDRLDDRTSPTSLSNPTNGAPWATMGTGDYVVLAPGSVAPAVTNGIPTPLGNSVTFAGGGSTARLGIFNATTTGTNISGPTITSGSTFYSFAMNVTDLSTTTTSGVFIGGLNTLTGDNAAAPTVIGTRIYIRRDLTDTTKFNIGTGKNPSAVGTVTWDATPLDVNTGHFIVGSYTIVGTAAGQDDIANVWINPANAGLGKGTAPTATLANVTDPGNDLNVGGVPKISSFVIRQSIPATILIDELRIDTSWAQVTQPAGVAWNNVGSGNWSDGVNWAGGVAPSGAETFAVLGPVATSNANVALTSNTTVSTITFDNALNGYTISNAGGNLILNAGSGGESGLHVHSSSHQINAGIALNNKLGINTATSTLLTIMGNISGPHAVRKAGAGTLWLGGNNSFSGGFDILGGTVALQGFNTLGAGLVTIDKATIRLQDGYNVPTRNITINDGGATFDSNGFSGIFGELTSNAGPLVKTNVGLIEFAHIRGGNISVNHGLLSITTNGGVSGVSRTSGLAISNSPGAVGRFNLMDNKLIVSAGTLGSATGGVYNGLQGLVQSGLNGGTWDGPGVITLMPDAVTPTSFVTTIGVATGLQINADLGDPGSGLTTALWAGQTINALSVLLMYTYGGDGNLDGLINADDYASIDFNAGNPSATGYYNGDYNYDGDINADDYSLIDFNRVAQGAPFFVSGGVDGVATVPEPAAAVAATALALLSTRRRRASRGNV